MIEALVFDFGNVVGFFDHGRTLAAVASHTDLTPAEMVRLVYGGDLEDRFEKGLLTTDEFLDEVTVLWKLRCDREFLKRSVADIFTPNEAVCALLPDLARHYRLVLGSNTNPLHAERFLEQFAEHLTYFEDLVLSFEVGRRKPAAEFFHHCREKAGTAAERCLFVDDLEANVAGAREAGLQAAVLPPGADPSAVLRHQGVEW